jgi:hypothetical protein
MSEDPCGFIAYTAITDMAHLADTVDRAMAASGFRVTREEETPTQAITRVYRIGRRGKLPWTGSPEVKVFDRHGTGLAQWFFFPLQKADLDLLTTPVYLRAIRSACMASETVLGRAFHATGTDMVAPPELLGAVDMLTWAQYFGPDLSAVIGRERLRTAPFYANEELPNGAWLARTAEAYEDEWPWEQRRPLLAHLGFTPRKLYYKTGPNSEAEARWC